MSGILSKQHIIAQPGFNRWLIVPAALGIHLCIGSVYAWSIFNPALIKQVGVVVSAADDWTLKSVVWIFTVSIVCLGLAAAIAGRWLEQVGPRMVGVVSACCWGGGFIVGGVGIVTHQLWLLYLGYGVLGGCGLGLGYVSPVSTLIRWFPDRRGMAAGMAIMGFGGGAMIGAPLKELFIQYYYRAPEYLGAVADLELITRAGRRFAEVGGDLREVVVVGVNEVAQMVIPGAEGVYLVGTGSVGVAATFFTMGVIYFVIMMIAAFSYRLPAQGWQPAGWTPPDEAHAEKKMMTRNHVDIDQTLKTRQFYQLWIVLCFNVTAGIGVLGVAKTMMTEIFGTTLPHIVDGGVCRDLRGHDQRIQHGRAVYLGQHLGLHRAAQYLLDILCTGYSAVLLHSIYRPAGQCQSRGGLAGVFLRRHHDHLYHVRRRLRHHSGIPGRYFRDKICRGYPWPPVDRLEHRRRAGPPGNHVTAGKRRNQGH